MSANPNTSMNVNYGLSEVGDTTSNQVHSVIILIVRMSCSINLSNLNINLERNQST